MPLNVLTLSTGAVYKMPTCRVVKIVIHDAGILCAFCGLSDRSYHEVQFEAIRMINKSLGD